MEKELSNEKIVILDFASGSVYLEYIPQEYIESDGDEIMEYFASKLDIRAKDCCYMVFSGDLQDNTN